MSTKLQGWAIPVKGTGEHADHTYVKSTDGKSWGCWGRKKGGNKICEGKGSSSKANCLSKPSGKALIVYGVTGVCHQTANRILRPSRKTVHKAKAYAASWALYGAYGGTRTIGAPEWFAQKVRCKVSIFKPDPVYMQEEEESYFESINNAHLNFAKEIQNGNASFMEIEKELAEIEFKTYLKGKQKNIDEATLKSIINSRIDMLAELEKEKNLILNLESISSFGDRANVFLNDFLKTAATILGDAEYESIFDIKPGLELTIVEKIDFEQHISED